MDPILKMGDAMMMNYSNADSNIPSNHTQNTTTGITAYSYSMPIEGVITVLVVILVHCVIGNATVIAVVLKKRGMQTFTNYLILNLAVADLSSGLLCITLDIPLELNGWKWIYGRVLCTMYQPLQTSTIYGSVFTLVIMSVSRYWAIMHPFRKQPTVTTAKVFICLIWVCSFLVVIPYSIVLDYDEKTQECKETWNDKQRRMYTLAIFIFQYILPLGIITVAYSFILYEIAVKNSSTKSLYEDKEKDKEAKRLVRLLLIITITFAVCMMPYHVIALWQEFGDGNDFEYINDLILGCYFLYLLNSILNPIIYNVFSSSFREAFFEMYKKIMLCYRQRKESTEGKLRDYVRSVTLSETISIRSPKKLFEVERIYFKKSGSCYNENLDIPGHV